MSSSVSADTSAAAADSPWRARSATQPPHDTTTKAPFDARAFRNALGAFTTGVTVVTTRSSDSETAGVTVNSFNSVSLDPPMVLWSLAKNAYSLRIFDCSEYWAVHILGLDQEHLSNRFARARESKFTDVELEEGIGKVPMLTGCAARLQCRHAFRYEGGDHVIFVGEVLAFDRSDVPPLVFQAGRYGLATPRVASVGLTNHPIRGETTAIEEDFLGYLLTRARFQFHRKRQEQCTRFGLSENEYFVLAVLAVKDGRSVEKIEALISYANQRVTPEILARLRAVGFLEVRGDNRDARCFLTDQGRNTALHIIAAGKAVEADVVAKMGHAEAAALKNLLKQLILQTDPGVPYLWDDTF